MQVREIKDKNTWDGFITAQKEHTFLHSAAWGELNRAMGDNIWNLGFYESDKLIAVALVIKVHARRGNFLFVPHGPIFKEQGTRNKGKVLKELTKKLLELAKQEEDIVFVRISPLLEDLEENKKIFEEVGYRDAPIYMHAETTWQLDLTKSEEELMMGMRKNTRNLVRRAEKDGVEIISGTDEKFIKDFFNLYKETAGKHGFTPFSEKYIKEEINAFNGKVKVYLAKYNRKIISGAVIVHYGAGAFYHHGASSQEYIKIPAAYLLQWRAILDAKIGGRNIYNFWGIAKNEENKKHPWYGLTFFKKGFGGYRTDYLHAQDMPLSKKYWLNYLIEKIRLLKRGV